MIAYFNDHAVMILDDEPNQMVTMFGKNAPHHAPPGTMFVTYGQQVHNSDYSLMGKLISWTFSSRKI